MSNTEQIVFELQDFLTNHSKNVTATSIIAKTMELVERVKGLSGAEKKDLVLKVIFLVAKGKDGVEGTDDDIIPKDIMDNVRLLIEKDLVGDVVDVIVNAANGKFDIAQTMQVVQDTTVVATGCFQALFGKKKKV